MNVERPSARRLAVLGLALAVLVVAAGSGALAASGGSGAGAGAASRRAAARRDVRSLLGRLRLPTAAAGVAGPPAGAGPALVAPPVAIATPNAVTLRQYWTVPGTPATVLAYVAAHPPAGGHQTLTGNSGYSGAVTATFLGFGFPATSVLGSRAVGVTAVADGPGQTALLAEAADVWLVARPGSERVPGSARLVTVAVSPPGPGAPARIHVVSARAQVDRLIAAVNRLPAAQPGVRSCPFDDGSHVDLAFRARTGGAVVATVRAQSTGCGGVTLALRGRPEPGLDGGVGFTAAVERIVAGGA